MGRCSLHPPFQPTSRRPNGSGDRSPGHLRPKADALGTMGLYACGLKGCGSLARLVSSRTDPGAERNRRPPQKELERLAATAPSNAGPTVSRPFRPHCVANLSTQGVGLRPRPWAPLSRPVGPAGRPLTSCFVEGRVPASKCGFARSASQTPSYLCRALGERLSPSTAPGPPESSTAVTGLICSSNFSPNRPCHFSRSFFGSPSIGGSVGPSR